MARVLGVRANRVIAAAFAISGLLAAAVSCLVVAQTGHRAAAHGAAARHHRLRRHRHRRARQPAGAALGGFLVGAATILLQALLPPDLRVFREAFVFVAVTLVLLFRPQGLIPARGLRERI